MCFEDFEVFLFAHILLLCLYVTICRNSPAAGRQLFCVILLFLPTLGFSVKVMSLLGTTVSCSLLVICAKMDSQKAHFVQLLTELAFY